MFFYQASFSVRHLALLLSDKTLSIAQRYNEYGGAFQLWASFDQERAAWHWPAAIRQERLILASTTNALLTPKQKYTLSMVFDCSKLRYRIRYGEDRLGSVDISQATADNVRSQ